MRCHSCTTFFSRFNVHFLSSLWGHWTHPCPAYACKAAEDKQFLLNSFGAQLWSNSTFWQFFSYSESKTFLRQINCIFTEPQMCLMIWFVYASCFCTLLWVVQSVCCFMHICCECVLKKCDATDAAPAKIKLCRTLADSRDTSDAQDVVSVV